MFRAQPACDDPNAAATSGLGHLRRRRAGGLGRGRATDGVHQAAHLSRPVERNRLLGVVVGSGSKESDAGCRALCTT